MPSIALGALPALPLQGGRAVLGRPIASGVALDVTAFDLLLPVDPADLLIIADELPQQSESNVGDPQDAVPDVQGTDAPVMPLPASPPEVALAVLPPPSLVEPIGDDVSPIVPGTRASDALGDRPTQRAVPPLLASMTALVMKRLPVNPMLPVRPSPSPAMNAHRMTTDAQASRTNAPSLAVVPRGVTESSRMAAVQTMDSMPAVPLTSPIEQIAVSAKTVPATVVSPGQKLIGALGERISVQVGQGIQNAVIRLDPHLAGSVRIELRHEAGALQIRMTASHAEVANQLQTISQGLRQELNHQQFTEVSVTVNHHRGGESGVPDPVV